MAYIKAAVLFGILLQLTPGIKSEEANNEVTSSSYRKGKEYYSYYAQEEDKKPEYPPLTYPPSYYPVRDDPPECPPNPLMPILGNGLNFLLLKLGAIGVIKAIVALVFLAFLVKLPLLLVKLAFVKSFFLPILIAPLLMNLFSQHMMQPAKPDSADDKPSEASEATAEGGRQLEDILSTTAWRSMNMLATSDQCMERIACVLGAYNNGTFAGRTATKLLKYLQYSSPNAVQDRMSSITDAFKNGSRSGSCSEQDYYCQSPELVLQHGSSKFRVL